MRKTIVLAVLLLCAVPAMADCLLTYQTEAVPVFYVGQQAHFQFEAVSGTPPYHFQIYSGTLPDGLRLKSDGNVKGKPTAESETVALITLTDAAGCTLTQAFNFAVFP